MTDMPVLTAGGGPAESRNTVAANGDRIPGVERLQDRYARWRRETWWRNEMGDKQSHFKAAEQFRR